MTTALVIGGAGFIGSHIVDALIQRGFRVTVLDNLEPQVHGPEGRPPGYLHPSAEFVYGDVRDRDLLARLVRSVDFVFYEAALIGVDQSMWEVRRYAEVNILGAANLADVLVNERPRITKIIVASSAAVYGEGLYTCSVHGVVDFMRRRPEQLEQKQWEPLCPVLGCNALLNPRPIDENKPLRPQSVYAITKRDQEEILLTVGRTMGVPVVALRYFNVYGPRQSASSPYSGVIAVFRRRLEEGFPPLVYEDGRQTRDFVHVADVVRANLLAMERDEANGEVFNVGTGQSTSIIDLADTLRKVMGSHLMPVVAERYRPGDVRHSVADITKARDLLGYTPQVSLEEGLRALIHP